MATPKQQCAREAFSSTAKACAVERKASGTPFRECVSTTLPEVHRESCTLGRGLPKTMAQALAEQDAARAEAEAVMAAAAARENARIAARDAAEAARAGVYDPEQDRASFTDEPAAATAPKAKARRAKPRSVLDSLVASGSLAGRPPVGPHFYVDPVLGADLDPEGETARLRGLFAERGWAMGADPHLTMQIDQAIVDVTNAERQEQYAIRAYGAHGRDARLAKDAVFTRRNRLADLRQRAEAQRGKAPARLVTDDPEKALGAALDACARALRDDKGHPADRVPLSCVEQIVPEARTLAELHGFMVTRGGMVHVAKPGFGSGEDGSYRVDLASYASKGGAGRDALAAHERRQRVAPRATGTTFTTLTTGLKQLAKSGALFAEDGTGATISQGTFRMRLGAPEGRDLNDVELEKALAPYSEEKRTDELRGKLKQKHRDANTARREKFAADLGLAEAMASLTPAQRRKKGVALDAEAVLAARGAFGGAAPAEKLPAFFTSIARSARDENRPQMAGVVLDEQGRRATIDGHRIHFDAGFGRAVSVQSVPGMKYHGDAADKGNLETTVNQNIAPALRETAEGARVTLDAAALAGAIKRLGKVAGAVEVKSGDFGELVLCEYGYGVARAEPKCSRAPAAAVTGNMVGLISHDRLTDAVKGAKGNVTIAADKRNFEDFTKVVVERSDGLAALIIASQRKRG